MKNAATGLGCNCSSQTQLLGREINRFRQKRAAETRTNRYRLVKSKFRLESLRIVKLWEKFLVTINLHA